MGSGIAYTRAVFGIGLAELIVIAVILGMLAMGVIGVALLIYFLARKKQR